MTGLPEAATPAGRAGLAAILADPGVAVIGLDFDGTLAPITSDPDAAYAHPGAVPALQRLAARVGSVVVVTGRPAGTAVSLGGLSAVRGHLTVLGHYGWERWDAASGEVTAPEPPPGVARVRAELPELLVRTGAPEGVRVEDKRAALAVHTRRVAEHGGDPDAVLDRLRAPLSDLAARAGLAVEPGRMVLELRPPGMDKGAALTAFVRERGARAVLFAGDDLGDLAAYDAVDALRGEDVAGVKVCSGSTEVRALAERADLVVDGPDGMVALLDTLATALGAPARR